MALLGRQRERKALDALLDAARTGRSATLVVHGEPGVGKTALVEYAIAAASGFDVLRAVGVESEIELPYAALQQLCAPILRLAERLPEPQRDALEVALGVRAGTAPSAILVGLAITGLLAEAAAERPLLAVVDDAQWLDRASAQAVAFAGRRLEAAKVALMIVARELDRSLAGFPELRVGNLGQRDARALLESALSAPLDDQVLERIVLETNGNPLALVELPRLNADATCRWLRSSSSRAGPSGDRRSLLGPGRESARSRTSTHAGGCRRPDRRHRVAVAGGSTPRDP